MRGYIACYVSESEIHAYAVKGMNEIQAQTVSCFPNTMLPDENNCKHPF